MDPFTAIGLAGNLVQFVDFAWKLVTETRDIAISMSGSSGNTRLLTTIVADFESSNAAIESIATDDEGLKNIIKQCRAVSERLLKGLERLKLEPRRSQWASFTVALKGVWMKKDIEELFESISRLRQRVLERLALITFTKVSGLVDKIESIDSAWARLEMHWQYDLQKLSSHIAESIREAVDAQKALDAAVRTARTVRRRYEEEQKAAGEEPEDTLLFESPEVVNVVSTSAEVLQPQIVTAMREIRDQGPKCESDLEFLESLNFPGIKARQLGIKDAHSQTFDWILGLEHPWQTLGTQNKTHSEEQKKTHSGERNKTHPGEQNKTHPGEQNKTHPGERNKTHPGEQNKTHPGEQNKTHPGERNKTHPGERNKTHPGEQNETHPGEQNKTHPGEQNKTHSGEQNEVNSPFAKWLEKEGGIFWIHGKPGCGKSTLMKFICGNPKTEKRLSVWAGPKRLVIARYFFWRAGSALQRTQQGLLRSLVFELVRRCPDLLPVAKTTLPAIDRFDSGDERWTKDQLLVTYKAIVSQTLDTRFCFFIDGLDEYYDGERKPQDLVKTIRELDFSSDVKLCISSRPYPIFLEEFGQNQNSERVLKVEDYTRGDIRHYVEERFKATGNFAQLQKIDKTYASFVDEVSDRAEGVFLWVVLVVANLEGGLENGDSVYRLRERLNSYPPDLDEFFLQMLKSVDARYRKQAMRTFEMVTSALHPLHAMLFWYLYTIDEDPKWTQEGKNVQQLSATKVQERLTQLRRKLQAQSQGLLEIVEDGDHFHPFFKYRLDFIHRTVRDFLSTSDEVQEQFRSELRDEPRTTWLLACQAILPLFRVAPRTDRRLPEGDFIKTLVKDLYFYASRARCCGDRSITEAVAEPLIVTGEALYKEVVEKLNSNQQAKQQHPLRLFLCLEAQYNFSNNLAKRFKTHGKSLKINRDGGRPVLDCALVEISGEGPVRYSEEVIKILLKNGAESTCVYQDNMTVWQRFVTQLADGQVEVHPRQRQTLVAILRMLLDQSDGVLNVMVETDEGQKAAEVVLRGVLSEEEQARISQLKKRGRGWFKSWRSR